MVVLAAAALAGGCRRPSPPPAPGAAVFHRADLPRIDAHFHLDPDAWSRSLDLMAAHGIQQLVDLSGGSPSGRRDRGLEAHLAAAAASGGRILVFTTPSFRECLRPGYGERMAQLLAIAHGMGAIGLKIPKGLGLGYLGPDLRLLKVDDAGLGPLWEKAGELQMPVAIHIGDPKAFWLPINEQNERFDELSVHPAWGYFGATTELGEPIPSWQQLYDAFERLVAAHPRTTFIGVHFGNDPEDPDRVEAMLTRYPNFYLDTAARIPEIGRKDSAHAQARMRAFFLKWQDRILFGTDVAVGVDPADLMLGSTGKDPPGEKDVERFFDSTFRYFETSERGFEHPTPVQGRWRIDGLGLPREVLAKLYAQNAQRLLSIVPPGLARPRP